MIGSVTMRLPLASLAAAILATTAQAANCDKAAIINSIGGQNSAYSKIMEDGRTAISKAMQAYNTKCAVSSFFVCFFTHTLCWSEVL